MWRIVLGPFLHLGIDGYHRAEERELGDSFSPFKKGKQRGLMEGVLTGSQETKIVVLMGATGNPCNRVF